MGSIDYPKIETCFLGSSEGEMLNLLPRYDRGWEKYDRMITNLRSVFGRLASTIPLQLN